MRSTPLSLSQTGSLITTLKEKARPRGGSGFKPESIHLTDENLTTRPHAKAVKMDLKLHSAQTTAK